MNVAIVGSGHGGCAMAGTLAMAGHDVTVVKLTNSIHVDNWNAIQERKTIRLSGIEGSGEFPIHATTKPE